jgi:hypothetical protein
MVVIRGENAVLMQWNLTDDAGRFEARGLPPGQLVVMAQRKRPLCQVTPHSVTLFEDSESGPVELRCREMKTIRGTVSSRRGLASGIRVEVYALPPHVAGGEATTQEDGSFVVQVPRTMTRATVSLAGTGFGTQQQEVTLGEQPLQLSLVDGVGSVEVQVPMSGDDFRRNNLRLVLFESNTDITRQMIRVQTEAGLDGEPSRMRASDLAPGDYSACVVRSTLPGSPLRGADRLACSSGRLEDGGALTLRIQPDD